MTQAAARAIAPEGFVSNRKDEAWKYTPVTLSAEQLMPYVPLSEEVHLEFLDGHAGIVFVDGVLQGELPKGVQWSADKETLRIVLAQDVQLSQPLHLYYLTSANAKGSTYTATEIVLEAGAKAEIVEHFAGLLAHEESVAPRLTQHHTLSVTLGKGASLSHKRLQELPQDCYQLYASTVEQAENSEYCSFALQAGAKLARQEVQVKLNGRGATADQRGITLAQVKQHMDTYLPVEHLAPGCYSNQHFRQLLGGAATGIFYGKVHVPEHAVNTEAHQLSKSLLLYKDAKAYTRPELDIHTDEVVCSHGATVGNLDEQAMYYLQTRGLGPDEARALLVEAFAATLVDDIDNEAVAAWVREHLAIWAESVNAPTVD